MSKRRRESTPDTPSNRCGICFDEYGGEEERKQRHGLACSHLFCTACVDQLLEDPHSVCPVCRRDPYTGDQVTTADDEIYSHGSGSEAEDDEDETMEDDENSVGSDGEDQDTNDDGQEAVGANSRGLRSTFESEYTLGGSRILDLYSAPYIGENGTRETNFKIRGLVRTSSSAETLLWLKACHIRVANPAAIARDVDQNHTVLCGKLLDKIERDLRDEDARRVAASDDERFQNLLEHITNSRHRVVSWIQERPVKSKLMDATRFALIQSPRIQAGFKERMCLMHQVLNEAGFENDGRVEPDVFPQAKTVVSELISNLGRVRDMERAGETNIPDISVEDMYLRAVDYLPPGPPAIGGDAEPPDFSESQISTSRRPAQALVAQGNQSSLNSESNHGSEVIPQLPAQPVSGHDQPPRSTRSDGESLQDISGDNVFFGMHVPKSLLTTRDGQEDNSMNVEMNGSFKITFE